jgi:hypothetical protein
MLLTWLRVQGGETNGGKKQDANLRILVWESLDSVKIPEKVDLEVDLFSDLGLVSVDPLCFRRC